MKQIITVLAILISGIASAQLFEVSSCTPGEIIVNEIDYIASEDLQAQIIAGENDHNINLVCITNVRVENGIPYMSRYFRRYLNAGRPSFRGDPYTGMEETLIHYTFPNGVLIRVYPNNYADGGEFRWPNGTSGRRNGHDPTELMYAGKFEVRRTANGSSIFTLHDTAKAAWDHARTH